MVQDSHPAGGLGCIHRISNVHQRACGRAEADKHTEKWYRKR